MGHPGKRAPTVEICDSDKPYVPLAMRQHLLGPYPFDPNLVSQGVPPDSRVDPSQNLYGPPEGTPPPPPPGAPTGPPPDAPVPPVDAPPAPVAPETPDQAPVTPPEPSGAPSDAPAVVPNAFSGNADSGASAAVTTYDPATGRYVGADGLVYRQTDLTTRSSESTWRDMLPH